MQLSTNFVKRPDSLVAPLAAALWCCAALLAALIAWLCWDSLDQVAESQRLSERQNELADMYQSFQTSQVPGPSAKEISELRRKVGILNGLASIRGMTSSAMLARMERKLPDPAYLVSFSYKPDLGETRLVAESREAEPLTSFLRALEQEEAFQEVLLTRQLHLQRQSIEHTRYEISLRSAP